MIDFGYDIDVDIEEIKSPLPSRKVDRSSFEKDETNKPEEKDNNDFERKELVNEEVNKNSGKKKIKIKKLLLFGAIGIIILILVAVIVNARKEKNTVVEKTTLNYWSLWEDQSVLNGVIADYEAKNPNIKINYKRNQLSNYRTRLVGRLEKSGISNVESVDIFRIHNTWIPMFRSYLSPVPQEIVTKVGLENDYFDVYKTDLKENGQFLSIPLMYDGLALFYNKDLVESAGVELPRTWWELKESASEITTRDENGKIKISGVALGTTSNVDHWSDIVGVMIKQNGIDLVNGKINEYENLSDVLSFYTSFVKKDKVWDESLAYSTELFANGKLAFYIGPSWRVFDIQNLNKDLNFGITTLPQLPVLGETGTKSDEIKLTNIHWSSYWTEGVNSKSKNKEEAWKFLEYLSSVEGLTKMYTAASQIRDFGEIYPRKSMVSKLEGNWKVSSFVKTADKASSWYLASETDDDGVNDNIRKYFKDAINSVLEGKDMEDTITALKNGVVQTVSKYKLKK